MGVMEEKKNAGLGFPASLAAGLLPGFIATVLFLFVSSLLVSRQVLPASLRDELILVSAFAGASFTGWAAAKRRGSGVLIAGLCAGMAYLLLLKLLSACVPSGSLFGGLSLKTAICSIAGGAFGGALRSRKKKQKRARRRR